MDNSDAAL